MRSSWAQPSLSRDFILLSAAVIFVLMMASVWVTYRTYEKHSQRVTLELGKEAIRIDNTISNQMANANYMLSSLGRQIIIEPNRDYVKLAQALKSFDNKNYIYSIFSWINTDKKMVVSSNRGVLEEPVDLSDRDFIQRSAADSWKMHIGRPIQGRVSGRWVIPVAMGITDYTGKFIGIVALSIDIEVLTDQIRNIVKRDGISFAIVTRDFDSKEVNQFLPLTEVSDTKDFIKNNFPFQLLSTINFEQKPAGLISRGSLIRGVGIYAYYRVSENFPYIVMMGYDANYSDETVRSMLWSRLAQIVLVAIFFVFFLWIVRMRVISPVIDITEVVAALAKGNKFTGLRKRGQVELEALVEQVEKVSKYIDENKRIENELRNKMFMLKKAKEKAELSLLSKAEFLAYITQELRMPVNNIVGFSQVLKDQVYGPIENRKYKQYASDIFNISNQLIEKLQYIIIQAKAESGYTDLQEKPLEIANIVNSSLKQLESKLQGRTINVKADIADNIPSLLADDFRMQQVIVNLLLIVLEEMGQSGNITIEIKTVTEHDKLLFVINIGNSSSLAAKPVKGYIDIWNRGSIKPAEKMDIRLELALSLIDSHGGVLNVKLSDGDEYIYTIIFPDSMIVFAD